MLGHNKWFNIVSALCDAMACCSNERNTSQMFCNRFPAMVFVPGSELAKAANTPGTKCDLCIQLAILAAPVCNTKWYIFCTTKSASSISKSLNSAASPNAQLGL